MPKKRKRRRGRLCTYCRRGLEAPTSPSSVAATRDHVEPACEGGTRTVPCCRACNHIKDNMRPDEWTAFMSEHPFWWKIERPARVRREWLFRRRMRENGTGACQNLTTST